MKTLMNHQILFDADCPMCGLYTKAFVKTGMLEKEGRIPYQNFPQEACPMLNKQRAADEIALINNETGEVTYGIESLFKVLGNSAPILRSLFGFRPFIWLMRKVYAFISYNRRVIIPADQATSDSVVQPTFKLHYRLFYLLFTWLITCSAQ
jgi:predicted DCC family thiol-disulfide oxidoreductase YuxK